MNTVMNEETKAGVSVTQMAQMLALSVRRFYQLMDAGVFPLPVYLLANRKPVFTEEQQRVCLDVKRRQCGINGRFIFFHSRRNTTAQGPKTRKPRVASGAPSRFDSIRSGLDTLGLTGITDRQIETTITTVFPAGPGQTPEHELIRKLFLHLKTVKHRADKVGG